MVGLALLLALMLELAAGTLRTLRWKLIPPARWSQLEIFRDAAWADEYHAELDRAWGAEWRSYVYWRRTAFAGKYINVDADGFRRTWRNPQAPPGAVPFRIFALGGSTMWGVGARDDFTIASLLAKLLAEQAPGLDISVTNFGEYGYVSTQELLTLELELQKGNVPDLVIFYDAINDVFSAFQNRVAGKPQNELQRRLDFENRPLAIANRAFTESQAFKPLFWWVQRRAFGDVAAGRTSEQQGILARDTVKIYASNLAIVSALGERYRFESLFYWQPVIFTKLRPSEDERKTLASENVSKQRDLFLSTYAIVRNEGELGRNPRFHDIQDIFGDDPRSVFIDAYHISEAGNEIIARRILEDLMKLLPPTTPAAAGSAPPRRDTARPS